MKDKINFAWPVTTLGTYDFDALNQCVNKNRILFHNKRIVIFGAGIRGTLFSLLLSKMGYKDIMFTDNNLQKIGGNINEFPIVEYDQIKENRDDIIVIISVENGFSLKIQLEQDGFKENINYFYIESNIYPTYVEEFSKKMATETLIMGDCGLTDIACSDEEYTNLGDMLKGMLGEKTKVLAMHAMGMRAFYHILKAQIENVETPKGAVIMTNFETFTGKQHLLPRSQHAKLIEMIAEEIEHKDSELEEYVQVTKERFENLKVDYFASSQKTMGEMNNDRNDRIVIRMNYMYKLQEDNECIVYLKRVIRLCRENSIKLMFFIPPVNYMYAKELYGDKFEEKYNANVNKLKEIVNFSKASILDLSYILESDKFADIHTIDETANYHGRKIVANAIVSELNK